jgi:hypothetical protein
VRASLRPLIIAGLAALLLASPPSASASTVIFRSDAELIALSERVVHARVIAQRTEWGQPPGRRIYTVTTLAVIEDFTGAESATVDVWELGGVVGGQRMFVAGQVEYRVGEEVLVCLERGAQGLRSVAMGFSKFDVTPTAADDGMLSRGIRDTMIVGGVVPARKRSLAEFRELAAAVLNRQPRRFADAAAPGVVAAPFTKIAGEPGWRWPEADHGVPVIFYKNTSAPPPLLSGDGVTEIQTALAGWTNPASASIILQYGGTTFETSVEGGWTSIPPRSGLITFEDPLDEMSGSTLALGGGFASTGTGGTVGGTTYDGFDSAFVILQNAVDLPPSFRQSLNFTRVVEHEIGHAIGFGHTQTDGSVAMPTANIMYPSCCFPETPTPPAIGPDDLLGLKTIYPAPPVSGPTMALEKTSLQFGATMSGSAFVWNTSPQTVRLTQTGGGSATWTATATRPWLRVTPLSGTGPVVLTISVTPASSLPAQGIEDGAISLTFAGAANTPGPIAVRLNLITNGQSAAPFGLVETPVDNSAGVTGAVPFTGWALDDIEVTGITICRDAVGGESPPIDARCGGTPQFFVGTALVVDGARPDVQAAFPGYPLNSKAGWGFMVLTNMLPSQGNGMFRFSAYASDRDGHVTLLGGRTITCDNAHATKPFGTIDTPSPGGIASGSSYVNFGWALTPRPKTIPIDGSTFAVMVDGVSVGRVTYNNFRPDVAGVFPGLNNTNGAVGYRILDTTTLADGLHTIAWVVTDDHGVTEGIGSRFFTVANSASGVSATLEQSAMPPDQTLNTIAIDDRPIYGRRSWDPGAAWQVFAVGAAGRAVIRGEEVDRFELWFGDDSGTYSGYLRVGDTLAPLAAGSRLDPRSGIFTWAPGAGFVGTYDFVFVHSSGARAVSQKNVRVILRAKGSGHIGAQVEIDVPRAHAIDQPAVLAGWAADLDAAAGSGIDALHIWAYPAGGGAPIFLGAAAYGGQRPDVAAIHGAAFLNTGFSLLINGLSPGTYDVAVFPWSSVSGGFVRPTIIRLVVR